MVNIIKFQSQLKKLLLSRPYDSRWGVYRAFNYRRNVLETYIDNDLKDTVKSVFDKYGSTINDVVKINALHDIYNFFSRFYKDGDFVATIKKVCVNDDVELIWANKGQYYVKSLKDGQREKDYFIHKDLNNYLKKQLESFIKDEILSLDLLADDIKREENIKCANLIMEIGTEIIDTISLFEEGHKKFWLKKKFILKTEYIITSDNIPKELLSTILKNRMQLNEWKEFGFRIPTSTRKLEKAKLPVDTRYYDREFKEGLLEKLCRDHNLDDIIDGIIIKGENWETLNLLMNRFEEKIKMIYIDPPYNTGKGEFIYRDSFSHSSWLTMMDNRLRLAKCLLVDDGVIFISIDENEVNHLKTLADDIFPVFKEYFIWLQSAGINYGDITVLNEFLLSYSKSDEFRFSLKGERREVTSRITKVKHRRFQINFPKGIRYNGDNASFVRKVGGPREPINIISEKMVFKNGVLADDVVLEAEWSSPIIIQKLLKGKPAYDKRGQEYVEIFFSKSGVPQYRKINQAIQINNILHSRICGDSKRATFQIRDLFGGDVINNPKPVELIYYITKISTSPKDDCYILDYFAGSGTTAHAVMRLNKEDGGKRKFILVEKADCFDTVILPRIKKLAYSSEWKKGKSLSAEGISGIYKYHHLGQYNDALDNVVLNNITEKKHDKHNFIKYYISNDGNLTKDFIRINMKRFYNPFSCKLKTYVKSIGDFEEISVDVIETFNYLLGLKQNKYKVRYNGKEKYLFILGKKDGSLSVM
ncbi:MAG TPA: site-specific DNA-methyltransferase [Thermoanaerobacterales bacterium]|nr:site-specific DNA-methyltransferase [Thermoanaerobacterales bacterium]